MIRITVETVVRPTEDLEKVKRAVNNVFEGELVIEDLGNGYYRLVGVSDKIDSLNKFKQIVVSENIGPAVRSYVKRRLVNNKIVILLHKQALFVSKVSLIDSERESPLGAVRITIEHHNPLEVIEKLISD